MTIIINNNFKSRSSSTFSYICCIFALSASTQSFCLWSLEHIMKWKCCTLDTLLRRSSQGFSRGFKCSRQYSPACPVLVLSLSKLLQRRDHLIHTTQWSFQRFHKQLCLVNRPFGGFSSAEFFLHTAHATLMVSLP